MPKLKKLTKEEKEIEQLILNKPLHPIVTLERARSFAVKKNRDRFTKFPDRLPTFGMLPMPIDEHEHIGLYENKQNIYLTFAHAFNSCMARIEELEKKK